MTNLDIATKYANDVLKNKVLSCKYVKLACKRFLDDLANDLYFYNGREVDKVITFLNSLYLTERSDLVHFMLEPWQTFIIANVYGIWNKSNQLRKYSFVYLELPRKNGKSQLVNALAVYHLIFDKDAQVVVSANSREQAKIVDFKKVKQFCSQIDPRKKYLKQYFNSIRYQGNDLLVTASDASRLDGLNISVGIIDELHEAKDSSMYDVFKSSQGSRTNTLLLTITTAGFNTESFCYQLRDYCIDILEGKKQDDSQFAIVYTIDDDDDFRDPESAYKANPNLGVSLFEHNIEIEVNKAQQNPVEASSIKVKHFNIWLQSKNVLNEYISSDYINQSLKKIKLDDFDGQDCYVGVDLGSVSDITSISYMFTIEDQLIFFNRYYLPEYSLNTSVSKKQYKQWADDGYITITSGNVTDYSFILKDMIEINKTCQINLCSYDSWNATQFTIEATEAGLNMSPFSQSTSSLNRPTKELSRLVMSERVIIEENPVTTWMFNNVILREYGENIRPDKAKKSDKIDGVMSMLMSLGGYLNSNHFDFKVY